jgi:peptidoglycan/xylan/chitin deacetylase (PgdA/CDA1 family)
MVGLSLVLAAVCTVCPAENAAVRSPINVLFTIDVESRRVGSLEQDIWGELPGESERHGIQRMMDILDRHGVKGTFFVNVYEVPSHREGAMGEVCLAIHQRGHDVELHTHPAPMFGIAEISDAAAATQAEILATGSTLLQEWTARPPIAHRAGNYAANQDTLEACRQAGISMDFSHNMAWPTCRLSQSGITKNAPVVANGVLCVPVTAYCQLWVGAWQSLRFPDIESSSPEEVRKVISDLQQHDVRTAVIMMHSFSFSRFGKPNRRVERALDELLAGLVADPKVRVVSARQLYDIWRADPQALAGGDYLPTTGWWMTYCRAWQRLDEGWQNAAVAFGPIVLCSISALAAGMTWRLRRRRRANMQARAAPVNVAHSGCTDPQDVPRG